MFDDNEPNNNRSKDQVFIATRGRMTGLYVCEADVARRNPAPREQAATSLYMSGAEILANAYRGDPETHPGWGWYKKPGASKELGRFVTRAEAEAMGYENATFPPEFYAGKMVFCALEGPLERFYFDPPPPPESAKGDCSLFCVMDGVQFATNHFSDTVNKEWLTLYGDRPERQPAFKGAWISLRKAEELGLKDGTSYGLRVH